MNVYCVVTCDLFHYGHVRFFKAARELGSRLVVGVCGDDDVAAYKQPPVLTCAERVEVVQACRYVDAVITDAPPYVSHEFIDAHQIDLVVAGADYSPATIEAYFRHPHERGILRRLPYTAAISSSAIIGRCQAVDLDGRPGAEDNLSAPTHNDHNRYSRERLLLSEEMYGTGHQTTAGDTVAEQIGSQLALQPGQQLLDVGCGTGGTTAYMARRWGVQVVGLDREIESIALCRERQLDREAVRFVQGDIRSATLGTTFDAFWTRDCLLYLRDKASCLSNIQRYLRPGGRGAVLDFCRGSGATSRRFADYLYHCNYHLLTPAGYTELFHTLGFEVVASGDITPLCRASMAADLTRLCEQERGFLSRHSAAALHHLRERWRTKIGFCDSGELVLPYFIVAHPGGR